MAAPTQHVNQQRARDLTDTLARLRMARLLDSGHAGEHVSGCEVCRATRRFNYLLDQLVSVFKMP